MKRYVKKLITLLTLLVATMLPAVTTVNTDCRYTVFPKYVRHVEPTKPHPQTVASRSETLLTYGPWQTFVATWYSGSGGSDGGDVTKTGERVRDGYTVAADPSVIPLGTYLQIRFADGAVRTYRAVDTGGAIVGNRIDIYESDTQKCLQNGRQTVQLRTIQFIGR